MDVVVFLLQFQALQAMQQQQMQQQLLSQQLVLQQQVLPTQCRCTGPTPFFFKMIPRRFSHQCVNFGKK
jgi:hypothetical protein